MVSNKLRILYLTFVYFQKKQKLLSEERYIEGFLKFVRTYYCLTGLFDNLFDNEIINLCSLAISPYEAKYFSASEPLLDAMTGDIPHPHFVTPPAFDNKFGLSTPLNVSSNPHCEYVPQGQAAQYFKHSAIQIIVLFV